MNIQKQNRLTINFENSKEINIFRNVILLAKKGCRYYKDIDRVQIRKEENYINNFLETINANWHRGGKDNES